MFLPPNFLLFPLPRSLVKIERFRPSRYYGFFPFYIREFPVAAMYSGLLQTTFLRLLGLFFFLLTKSRKSQCDHSLFALFPIRFLLLKALPQEFVFFRTLFPWKPSNSLLNLRSSLVQNAVILPLVPLKAAFPAPLSKTPPGIRTGDELSERGFFLCSLFLLYKRSFLQDYWSFCKLLYYSVCFFEAPLPLILNLFDVGGPSSFTGLPQHTQTPISLFPFFFSLGAGPFPFEFPPPSFVREQSR